MAGLAGQQSWDLTWSLAAKGVEKFLRGPLDWFGGGGADLSWAEYSWASKTFLGRDIFLELPKSLTKMLTVEIVPGATCQLRLAAESSPYREMNKQGNAELERSGLELKDTLDQLATLVARARHLVAPRATSQMQFNLGVADSEDTGRSPSRRRKRP